ncbi:HAD-IA family hydrolase [Galbitalea soli]|uniref:HAD family phosphatase n=1 Tax=Galbitalea soli TaxID=1268042 RepID=A0A7C9PLX7_9MICO|nr:HAD family phosphatase [Galbitalea soli]NYJ31178.1 putative hydrolase of the HAD superfamily [Galbitalea soli]
MDLYLFDFDKTLYAYDSRKRLPAQSRLSGVSQYHLAKSWWVPGYEVRAELGEWPSAQEYLDEFARVTGARLTLDQWCEARHAASTPNPGVVAALRRASTLGTVGLFSNNPPTFSATLSRMAPDVAAILGPNVLVSWQLGIRKPDPAAFLAAVAHYGGTPERTFFVDDSAANVAGARSAGLTAFQYRGADDLPALDAAIDEFAARGRA